MQEYLKANKALWNQKTLIHEHSEFYQMPAFLEGATSLKPIELALLGEVKGKKILHLQCHFGQDTISLARMGAKVTGLDLSDTAIAKAKEIANKLNIEAHFVCCDIFEADQFIEDQFDIVFTSYGTIGWLPTLDRWGQIIQHFLKPNGQFVFAEFHPFIWTLDDATYTQITYSYFNIAPIIETLTSSYTDGDSHAPLACYTWNHSLSEVFNALKKNGIVVEDFQEYKTSPYNCFPNTVTVDNGFQIKGMEDKLPMIYSIVGRKS